MRFCTVNSPLVSKAGYLFEQRTAALSYSKNLFCIKKYRH